MSTSAASSEVDQILLEARRRAAGINLEPTMTTTPPVPPEAAAPAPTPAPRPSLLRDSLRLTPMKKTAVAAATTGTSSSGVDADRPRPPALKTEAELAAPDAWPDDFLSKLIEACRRVLQKIASFFVSRPTPAPAGAMQTLDADTDPRENELRALREEVQQLKQTLVRYRSAAEAAGLSLDNALEAQDVTEKALDRGARALELDRQRDRLRNEKESKAALPGDAQLARLASANFKLAHAQHGRDDVVALGEEAVAAANDAQAWSTVKAVGAAGSIAHALVGEQLFLQKAIGEVLDEQEQQSISDREHTAQELDIGPERAPSLLDVSDAKRANELRAQYLAASRRLRLLHLHAHEIHHVPPQEQEAFQALPLGAERMQFLKDHQELVKREKAQLEEAIQDAALARNQAAALLWPVGLDDSDADGDADQAEASYEQQERPR
ncbi:hypothetical protein GmRootV59_22900 [Variovorax sp. V59]|uniref:hypothetical protein n=1 Tax=unclassified Variovorax TaxID=663243 RepID=UPI0034E841D0